MTGERSSNSVGIAWAEGLGVYHANAGDKRIPLTPQQCMSLGLMLVRAARSHLVPWPQVHVPDRWNSYGAGEEEIIRGCRLNSGELEAIDPWRALQEARDEAYLLGAKLREAATELRRTADRLEEE